MKHRQEAEALEVSQEMTASSFPHFHTQDTEIQPTLCLQARQRSGRDKIWAAVVVDSELGMDCGNFKWQQNQSYIEIFCRVPDNVPTHEVP